MLQCLEKGCETFTILDSNALRPIALGTSATVEMRWDPVMHEFVFETGPNKLHTYSYSGVVSDISSPGLPFKHLQAQNDVANCTTVPRPVANVSALYDNISVDTTCQLPQTSCSSDSVCCHGICGGNGNTTCCLNSLNAIPADRVPCSSNQDCCSPFDLGDVVCGGQGTPHCCLVAGSSCDLGGFCCSEKCDPTGSFCL